MWRYDWTELRKVELKELSLFIAVFIIMVPLFWLSQGAQSFLFQIFTLMAEASISVFVTLVVIEKALKDDRKHQSEKVRWYTYRAIIWNICLMAVEAIWETPIWHNQDDQKGKRIDTIRIIGSDIINPRKEVSDTIRKVAFSIDDEMKAKKRKILERREEYENKEKLSEELNEGNRITLKHFEKIDRTLNEIRIVLIPRALQISDNSELNRALLDFEENIRFYERVIVTNPNLASTLNMKNFLLAASDAYDALEKEYRNESFPRKL